MFSTPMPSHAVLSIPMTDATKEVVVEQLGDVVDCFLEASDTIKALLKKQKNLPPALITELGNIVADADSYKKRLEALKARIDGGSGFKEQFGEVSDGDDQPGFLSAMLNFRASHLKSACG